jgi:2,5-diketo-D-gluconate reductase A
MQIDRDVVPRITLHDGSTIPQLGFGTLAVQPDRESSDANAETTGRIVRQALEAGYRHIDTAVLWHRARRWPGNRGVRDCPR